MGVLQLCHCKDRSRPGFRHRGLDLAVHQQEIPQTLPGSPAHILHFRIRPEDPGTHTDKTQLPDEGIVHALIHQTHGRAFVRNGFFTVISKKNRSGVRARENLRHGIHQFLHADILGGTACKDRDHPAGDDGGFQPLAEFIRGECFAFQIAAHQIFIGFRNGIHPHGADFRHRFSDLRRNIFFKKNIDDSAEIGFFTHRPSQRQNHIPAVIAPHFFQSIGKTGPVTVQTVDQTETGDFPFTGKFPGTGSTDLRAFHSVQDHQCRIRRTHPAGDFAHKFSIPGSIGEKEILVLPHAMANRSVKTALLFLFIRRVIGNGILLFHGTAPFNGLGLEQNQFRQRRFTTPGVTGKNKISTISSFLHKGPLFVLWLKDFSVLFSNDSRPRQDHRGISNNL